MPRLPKSVTVPTDYQAWLADLRKYLDRRHGARADLARHLADATGITPEGAQVKVSRILTGSREPSAGLFLTIAAWHAQQTA